MVFSSYTISGHFACRNKRWWYCLKWLDVSIFYPAYLSELRCEFRSDLMPLHYFERAGKRDSP